MSLSLFISTFALRYPWVEATEQLANSRLALLLHLLHGLTTWCRQWFALGHLLGGVEIRAAADQFFVVYFRAWNQRFPRRVDARGRCVIVYVFRRAKGFSAFGVGKSWFISYSSVGYHFRLSSAMLATEAGSWWGLSQFGRWFTNRVSTWHLKTARRLRSLTAVSSFYEAA